MEGKIKEVNSFEDFKNVYQVFSGPPYYEKYTNESLKGIFDEYKKNGYLYGAFTQGKTENCVGIVALEEGIQKGHPVSFAQEKIMYLSDVAVLSEHRKTGLGTQLMLYAVMQSKVLGFQRLYMRTLEPDSSMSYGIALKIGYNQIAGASQIVTRERTDGSTKSVKNIFLDIDLENLNKDAINQSIKLTCAEPDKSERVM